MAQHRSRIVLEPRPVASSLEELLQGSTDRQLLESGDAKSGAVLERVVINGERYVVKHISFTDDWLMRASGDLTGREVILWESGLLHSLPPSIDHATVGAARYDSPDGPRAALLMNDVGPWLVPEGDSKLPLEQHLRFLDRMAEIHAWFWEWTDTVGLMPLAKRYLFLNPDVELSEAALGSEEPIPKLIGEGWRLLPNRAPRTAKIVLPLLTDLRPFLKAVEATPQTLLIGDWKATNLGTEPDGRTILLDRAFPGVGPACSELAWYLAINTDRLPHSKEDTIEAYRISLERHGIRTAPWWETQLSLALLGAVIQFGWQKVLGGDEELGWWEEMADRGARYLA